MRLGLSYILQMLLSIPKTIIFNFHYLPFVQAVKLPFFVHYRTIVNIKNGKIIISKNVTLHRFMIKIGNKGSEGIVEKRYNAVILNGGTIVFKGKAAFGIGSSLRVEGNLEFGENFNTNRNTFISCTNKITFGKNVLMGWNVSVRDSDGHTLMYNGELQPTIAPVSIGNNVWVCAETHILKGVIVGDNCVIGYKSLLAKGAKNDNVLWAGHPAKIVKDNISWDRIAWDVKKIKQ